MDDSDLRFRIQGPDAAKLADELAELVGMAMALADRTSQNGGGRG